MNKVRLQTLYMSSTGNVVMLQMKLPLSPSTRLTTALTKTGGRFPRVPQL